MFPFDDVIMKLRSFEEHVMCRHCGQQCACWGPSTINSSRQSDAETRPAIIDSDNGLSPVQCQQLFEPMLAHWETNFSEI